MGDYVISILFDDNADVVRVELGDAEREVAEAFTAQLRADVEHATSIGAPVLEVQTPGAFGPTFTLDPRHVRSVDLEEAE